MLVQSTVLIKNLIKYSLTWHIHFLRNTVCLSFLQSQDLYFCYYPMIVLFQQILLTKRQVDLLITVEKLTELLFCLLMDIQTLYLQSCKYWNNWSMFKKVNANNKLLNKNIYLFFFSFYIYNILFMLFRNMNILNNHKMCITFFNT